MLHASIVLFALVNLIADLNFPVRALVVCAPCWPFTPNVDIAVSHRTACVHPARGGSGDPGSAAHPQFAGGILRPLGRGT